MLLPPVYLEVAKVLLVGYNIFMNKATVRELVNLKGKRVFLRSDLNVPQDKAGNITDDSRIRESLDTIKFLLDKGAKVILCSHLGRPKGEDESLSLKPVFDRLVELLPGYKLDFKKAKDGQLLLLENIRFKKGEEKNCPELAKELAGMADYFVNDAFGAAHRAHASTEGIAKFLPAVAGFLMEREIKFLGEAISSPRRPLTLILGGKKIADKIGVINGMLERADNILIGGGMSYTFAAAFGGEIGNSIVNPDMFDYCRNIMVEAKKRGVNIVYALDSVCGDKFGDDAHTMVVDTDKIPKGWEGFDIGPKTIEKFKEIISKSCTVIWAGPLGVFEFEKFATGMKEIASAVIESGAVTIIGGGDSAAAVYKLGIGDKFTHISTGGGASVEFLEGKTLPGIEALLGRDVVIK